jgi:hypothetical protein
MEKTTISKIDIKSIDQHGAGELVILIKHMHVHQRDADISIAKQFLDGMDIVASYKLRGSDRMLKGVAPRSLGDLPSVWFFHSPLQHQVTCMVLTVNPRSVERFLAMTHLVPDPLIGRPLRLLELRRRGASLPSSGV